MASTAAVLTLGAVLSGLEGAEKLSNSVLVSFSVDLLEKRSRLLLVTRDRLSLVWEFNSRLLNLHRQSHFWLHFFSPDPFKNPGFESAR